MGEAEGMNTIISDKFGYHLGDKHILTASFYFGYRGFHAMK